MRKSVESFEELQNLLNNDKTVYLDNAGPFGTGTAKVLLAYIGQDEPTEDQSEDDELDPDMEVVVFNKKIWQLSQRWTDFDNCRYDLYYEEDEEEE